MAPDLFVALFYDSSLVLGCRRAFCRWGSGAMCGSSATSVASFVPRGHGRRLCRIVADPWETAWCSRMHRLTQGMSCRSSRCKRPMAGRYVCDPVGSKSRRRVAGVAFLTGASPGLVQEADSWRVWTTGSLSRRPKVRLSSRIIREIFGGFAGWAVYLPGRVLVL